MAAEDAAQQEQYEEAFLQALYQGSDLLGRGQLEEARDSLEWALTLRPDDPKARNLLGLSCFKLGDYDRADQIYRGLIAENPEDATLRVNLGLVDLKRGRFEEAIRELEAAVERDPAHTRAQNYLGLAYARVGEYERARVAFEAAGSAEMVAKMDRALAERGPAAPAPEAAAPAETPPPAPAEVPAPEAEAETVSPADLGEPDEASVPVDPSGPAEPAEEEEPEEAPAEEEPPLPAAEVPAAAAAPEAPMPSQPPAAEADLEVDELPVEEGPAEPEPPAELAARPPREPARPLPGAAAVAPDDDEDAAFAIAEDLITARVDGELLARLHGLVAAEGELAFQPELKRFRGRTTEKPFGQGELRVQRVTGEGRLLIARRGRTFSAVELGGGDGYFTEAAVCAFPGTLDYENGRVASPVSPDLNLVHLRGQGAVLLETGGPLVSLRADPGHPLRIPLDRLVGWQGPVVPRVGAVTGEGGPGDGALVAVELSGEGVVLVALPADED